MCGLTGFFQAAPAERAALTEAADRMRDRLERRGPDDAGTWAEPGGRAVLAFRRLAIMDLSPMGHQPMTSASGRFTLVFNGEVFNHGDLRRTLAAAGHRFRGHSDTEVILAAFEAWGVEAAVRQFVGMFAIAVWDEAGRSLTLLRDRLGIKPLFVYAEPGYVGFGSELKALAAGPRFDRSIDPEAVVTYLRYLYVPAPASIFRRVQKLPPGHLLTITDPAAPLPPSRPFWAIEDVADQATAFTGGEAEYLAETERLVTDAVRLRMEADVPLGALLSGGIDSSLVVATMQALAAQPVRTFTIGFDDPTHDETGPARAIAAHLGTDHTEMRLDGAAALEVVPGLPEMFDEPLANPSQIPTYLVCRLARQHVTVALTGDGGDELFAGYNRYLHGDQWIRRAGQLPAPVRRLMTAGIGTLSPTGWDRALGMVDPVLPRGARVRLAGQKLHKVGRMLAEGTEVDRYRSLVSAWQRPVALAAGGTDRPGRFEALLSRPSPAPLLDRMRLADQAVYLPDDLLAKVDRCSMAVSLEARVPLLDHRLVEWSWRLPPAARIRDGRGKWILRALLARRLPRELFEREKVGFTVPVATWLRGPLREWAGDLLSSTAVTRGGLLDPKAVQREWTRFRRGGDTDGLGIWALVHLQAWAERWAA